MPEFSGAKTPIHLFMSFCDDPGPKDWVGHARDYLQGALEVHDFRKIPETGANLTRSLRDRIAKSDVFICVLDEKYLKGETTQSELEAAIEGATGSKQGLLMNQQHKPLVYIIAYDPVARTWLKEHQEGYTYIAFDKVKFAPSERSFAPIDPEFWRAWMNEMRERLEGAAVKTGEPSGNAGPKPVSVVLLGRPSAAFQGACAEASTRAAGKLGEGIVRVADGWHDRRDVAVTQAVETLAKAAPRSLLIQPCDETLHHDNTLEGEDLGSDLRAKLRQVGTSRETAQIALQRTLFWVPRGVDVKAEVPPLDPERTSGNAPLFGLADLEELVTWVRTRLGDRTLTLKAENGIEDIAPKLKSRLERYLGPLDFDLFDPDKLALSVQQAAAEGSPLLIAIHDRKVDALNAKPRATIKQRAQRFDDVLDGVLQNTPRLKVARAVLLVRHSDLSVDESFIANQNWYWLPLNPKDEYAPSEQSVNRVREALSLPLTSGA
jgi:hypothetical protein